MAIQSSPVLLNLPAPPIAFVRMRTLVGALVADADVLRSVDLLPCLHKVDAGINWQMSRHPVPKKVVCGAGPVSDSSFASNKCRRYDRNEWQNPSAVNFRKRLRESSFVP